MTNSILAEIPAETAKQIAEIYERIGTAPAWSFRLVWMGLLALLALTVMIFLRQKKIARNQVNLAQMMAELAEKK